MVKNVTVHGIYWGSYAMHSPRPMRRSLEDSVQWLAQGKVRHALANHAVVLDMSPGSILQQGRHLMGF